MTIYVIVNAETLKIYVGQHKRDDDLERYMLKKISDAAVRRLGARSYLYAAMRKHPRAAWSIHPLVSGIESKSELDDLERHFIKVLKSQHPDVGYNICDGGEGFTGPHSEDAKRKIRVANIIAQNRPDVRMPRLGIHKSPATEIKAGEHISPATEIQQRQHKNSETEIKMGQHLGAQTEFQSGQHASPQTEIQKGQHLSRKTEFVKGCPWSAEHRRAHELANAAKKERLQLLR